MAKHELAWGRLLVLALTSTVIIYTFVHLACVPGFHFDGLAHSHSTADRSAPEHQSRQIPQYVLDHAPLVHLFSEEQFWPCDMSHHLNHTLPFLNYTKISSERNTLEDLNQLNRYGRHTFLTSDDDVESRPNWLGGKKNIPHEPKDGEHAPRALNGAGPVQAIFMDQESDHPFNPSDFASSLGHQPEKGGYSRAPAVLVMVPKPELGNNTIDAFWFFFYSYNLGNSVFNIRFGNHVGDWEHTLVRFENEKPTAVFYSEHFFGSAYEWGAVEKIGQRPVSYSGVGTHAMYATPGVHQYILPWGLLQDRTDKGPLWDPVLNVLAYTYNFRNGQLQASNVTSEAPVEWFYFGGKWGDKAYPSDDHRQYSFWGQYHYVSGPLGPRFKRLGRKQMCQGGTPGDCDLQTQRPADGATTVKLDLRDPAWQELLKEDSLEDELIEEDD